MTKWIGKASLTMRPTWRIVLSYRFHIGCANLSSPFYEVIGRIDENLDPGGRQAHVRGARLLLLTRHSFVEKERRAIEVKPSNAVGPTVLQEEPQRYGIAAAPAADRR